MVYLFLLVRRVRQLARQVAVVGEEQHPHSLFVETTDRIDTLLDLIAEYIHDSVAVGIGVVDGGDEAFGLVHHYLHFLFAAYNLIVETYLVARFDLGAELRYYRTVDAYRTRLYVRVGLASRTYAGHGYISVQPYLSVY